MAPMNFSVSQRPGLPEKKFLSVLNGKTQAVPPVWLMRQAGRYLPEYLDIRKKAGSFLDLALNPDLASEAALQPLRRYGLDAAILFSDILVVPMALGQKLWFEEGEGPRLEPLALEKLSLGNFEGALSRVYDAVSKTRRKMDQEEFREAALIGFAGAPWTLACYMIEGQGKTGFRKAISKTGSEELSRLIDLLVEATVLHLSAQIRSGAEAVQIFDSWAGLVPEKDFEKLVTEPTRKIVQGVRARHPRIPIIGFPREAGKNCGIYAEKTGISALSLDQGVTLEEVQEFQKKLPVQGNLDPALLQKGGEEMREAAEKILDALGSGPFIFNLGHGILKETPVKNVSDLLSFIRNRKA